MKKTNQIHVNAILIAFSFTLAILFGCGDDKSTSASENSSLVEPIEKISSSSKYRSSSSYIDKEQTSSKDEDNSVVENLNETHSSSQGSVWNENFQIGTSLDDFFSSDIKYGEMVDARDGKKYKTTKIGKQEWMAQNLNFGIGGSYYTYPEYYESANTVKLENYSICYEYSADSCAKYGRLYDWYAAKTACPADWHLPSKKEWEDLINFIAEEQNIKFPSVRREDLSDNYTEYIDVGVYFKSANGWAFREDLKRGVDAYGFSAIGLPKAYANSCDPETESYAHCNGITFDDILTLRAAYFWTSTATGNRDSEWDWDIVYGVHLYDNPINLVEEEATILHSIRCIKDSK